PHFFRDLKSLTRWGYFTSEAGVTKALRYNPIPGSYKGCVPYEPGEIAWY
ncbi:MAG: gluconate 2-dehydrogenase subunit 3 family protein, partial [Haliscomenobacter sp.]